MKKLICLVACLMLNSLVFGQEAQPQPARPGGESSFQTHLQKIVNQTHQAPDLPTFDLDFSGGSPADLVRAIEAAAHAPLNVIINKEDEDVQIPPLKMKGVNVNQLFQALESASIKHLIFYNNVSYTSSYSFRTTGEPTEHSIWFFHADKGLPPQAVPSDKICQFYSLANDLDRGFTVDDITTAIQAGWKMSGVVNPPELNYHKETKMLIAYGTPRELDTIRQVLGTLPSSNVTRNELDSMRQKIATLQTEVEKLKTKGSPDKSQGASTEEKIAK